MDACAALRFALQPFSKLVRSLVGASVRPGRWARAEPSRVAMAYHECMSEVVPEENLNLLEKVESMLLRSERKG